MNDKLKFIAIFFTLGLIGLNVPFTKLAGSNVSFTLFDFFAPIAGAFLGPLFGIVTVFAVEIANLLIKQTPLQAGSLIRLFPVLFATYYFAVMAKQKKSEKFVSKEQKWIHFVPLFAIIAFLAHPIGRTVPYYTLFWTIPFIAYLLRKNLFMRSLGATFTAHSVGGAAWIWAFNLPAQVWQGLIPVVVMERFVFATGITVSYVVIRSILTYLSSKKLLPSIQKVNPRYL